MRALFNRSPSPALVISIMALFMATTGGAVAAVSASGHTSKTTELWAVISGTGHVISGNGVKSTSQPFGPGTYQVLFNRNVVKCAYAVSRRYPPGFDYAEPRSHHKNGVYVQIENTTGTSENDTFSLQVAC